MARYAPLWQQAQTYSASLDRGLFSALFPKSCVVGAPQPSVVGGTMNISLPADTAAVACGTAVGSYVCRWSTPEQVTLPAAPPSGQSRIDVVILQVRDNALDSGGNNDFIFATVSGAPAASNPAVPAVPTNAMAMHEVTVPGGAAVLDGVAIRERRLSMSKPTISVPAGSPTVIIFDTSDECWVARGGVNLGGWARARDVLTARYWQQGSTFWLIDTNWTNPPWDSVISDPYGLRLDSGPDGYPFRVPVAGDWEVMWCLGCAGSQANDWLQLASARNNAVVHVFRALLGTPPTWGFGDQACDILTLNAGDTINGKVKYARSFVQGQTGRPYAWITVKLLSPAAPGVAVVPSMFDAQANEDEHREAEYHWLYDYAHKPTQPELPESETEPEEIEPEPKETASA